MPLQEFWSSLTINTKDKIKNPFFGSLALVWVFYHHSELYRLLFCYQDHQKEMNDLNLLFAVDWNLLLIVCKTLGVMVASYCVLGLTNLFVMSYSNRTVPWLLDLSSKGAKVVEKSKYDKLLDEYSSINAKHNRLIEERNEAVSKRLDLEQERDKAKLDSREADLKQQSAVNEKVLFENMANEEQAKAKGLEQSLLTERKTHEGVTFSLNATLKEVQQLKQDNAELQAKYEAFQISQIKLFRSVFMASNDHASTVINELKHIELHKQIDFLNERHYQALHDFGYITATESGAADLTPLGKLLLKISLEAANGIKH